MTRTTHVKTPTGVYEERLWTHPLLIAICTACNFHAVSVSIEASNAAVWDHTVAVHLGGSHASRE